MRGKISSVMTLLAALCVAVLSGCADAQKAGARRGGADGEVEAVLKEMHEFAAEIVRRVEAAPDPAAGVDAAQKYLDSRRSDILAKIDALKRIDDAQLSEATRGRKMESLTDDLVSVNGLQIKFMTNAMNDDTFKAKLDKLLNDYRTLVDV